MGFQGYDIASGFNNYSNLLAQGYKDQLALRQYQEQAALKAQQQAFANEIAGREAEAKFGRRSYNQDLYPGLYEPMIPAIAERAVGGPPELAPGSSAANLRMPAPFNPNPMPQRPMMNQGVLPNGAPGPARDPSSVMSPSDSSGVSGYPSLPSSREAEIQGNFDSAVPEQDYQFYGNRSPGMARAQNESTGDKPGILDRIMGSAREAFTPGGLTPVRGGEKFAAEQTAKAETAKKMRSSGYNPDAQIPGRGLDQMMGKARDMMQSSPQFPAMVERAKQETAKTIADEHIDGLKAAGEKKPNVEAVNKVAKNVVDTFAEATRDPAMDQEALVKRLGGYIDPYTGQPMIPKGTMEMLKSLEQREISARNKEGGLGDMIKLLGAQNDQQNFELRRDMAERQAALALSGRANPQAPYQAQGIQAKIRSAQEQLKSIDARLNSDMSFTIMPVEMKRLRESRQQLMNELAGLSEQMGQVGGRPMDYNEALTTVRGGNQQAPQQAAPRSANQEASRDPNYPPAPVAIKTEGGYELTMPDGSKRAVSTRLYNMMRKQGQR